MHRECNRWSIQYERPLQRLFITVDLCGAMHMNLILCLLALLKVSLFSLLNDIAASIRDSYHGGSLWEKQTQDKSHRRLSPIGETWWWVKHENSLFMQYSHWKPLSGRQKKSQLYVPKHEALKRVYENM